MSYKYDFLIVGAGLFGSVCAFLLKNKGYNCLVVDKRDHIGGNCYTEEINGINVHKYGAHIFHTNDKKIWDFVNSFVEFNRYTNAPIANFRGNLYNLPFNMNTFYQLWKVTTPEEAEIKINEQILEFEHVKPTNLEEQALKLVGRDIYEKLIKGYSEKQWGRPATELPPSIIKRLPIRLTFDNNYFNDKYQGIPIGGYTKIFEKLLEGIELSLGVDFLKDKDRLARNAKKIIYTGCLDEYYDYKYGKLEYRSLDFKIEKYLISNYQGNAVVNYTDSDVPYTRIIEHKHFEFGNQKSTVITKEFPKEWVSGDIPYYPINNELNDKIFKSYLNLSIQESDVYFGGRLAEYRYYDMHQVIGSAFTLYEKILKDDKR